jgi:cytochrome b6-f complex subunit 5
MVEVLLSGIVLGLVPVTITGLFVAAYLQYRRGNQFGLYFFRTKKDSNKKELILY